jgi:hypothetical protein
LLPYERRQQVHRSLQEQLWEQQPSGLGALAFSHLRLRWQARSHPAFPLKSAMLNHLLSTSETFESSS